ncbi:hypothetical protein AOQ84DRAFT_398913 [Glonium stellatum]|uniref:Dipeptidase n=1 Tax=Glonium stellatum TaxID=574774 RepID=A0A8E2EYD0_9PEZI|nr:hypothetical protein AOQ84DRAFT_398913 [Glonium stellatum]
MYSKNETIYLEPHYGHNDFPIWIRAFYHNRLYQRNFSGFQDLYGQVDFPRLLKGRSRGQFWSVYIECPKNSTNYSNENYQGIIHDTLQQIDIVYRLIKEFPMHLRHVFSAAQLRQNLAYGAQISSLMGIEGLHQIGNSASVLRMYHALGVRYATLTHTCHNKYADSEAPGSPLHGGLSEAGKEIVREMNRLGIIVDLSHTSFATQRDALNATVAPVIFSHSNAYSVYKHTRNVPDDVLQMLKANDGIVMISFYPQLLSNEANSPASLLDVVDHIEYVGKQIGYWHVGLGSDFDGMDHGPVGLEDVSKYPNIVEELLRRGVKKADIENISGGNILRVLEKVEQVAASLVELRPLEDNVKPFFDT